MTATSPNCIFSRRNSAFSRMGVLLLLFTTLLGCTKVWAQPDNDAFVNAVRFRGTDISIPVISLDASKEPGEPTPPYVSSVWYTWTAPAKGTLDLQSPGGNAGAMIFTGNAVNALNYLGQGQAAVEPGITYRIAFENPYPDQIATLRLKYWPQLTNDLFQNSAVIQGEVVPVNEMFAGVKFDALEPVSPQNQNLPVAWWTWIAPADGMGRIRLTKGSGAVQAFSGTNLGALTLLGAAGRFEQHSVLAAAAAVHG